MGTVLQFFFLFRILFLTRAFLRYFILLTKNGFGDFFLSSVDFGLYLLIDSKFFIRTKISILDQNFDFLLKFWFFQNFDFWLKLYFFENFDFWLKLYFFENFDFWLNWDFFETFDFWKKLGFFTKFRFLVKILISWLGPKLILLIFDLRFDISAKNLIFDSN